MAINNTDNPEEGTPRDKKDIRRERRQMKSINKGRVEMGGEPLYSKQEIKDVSKPFKSEPGKALSGTIQGTTYNDPNKPSEPDYEYKIYESGGPGVSATTRTAPVTKEQFQALTSDNPKEGEAIRNVILNNSNATTVTDVIQTKTDNDNSLTLKEKEDLTKTSIIAGNEIDKIDKDITDEELQNKSQLQKLGEGPMQYNWTDAYVKEGFTPESPEAILSRAANAARQKAPQLVIEKLGVQDYYPEIGRDIAVGTFSGSRIGSQTIYSGAGGLLPLGLYDARKRAIAADIKKKEALMDQLKEIPDIAKQFKPAFAQDFYEGLQPYLDAYKDNPEGLASDPGFLKYIANKKSVGEAFIKTDAYLKDVESKLVDTKTGDPAAWVPDGMLKIINNIKAGMVPGKIEDYFSGKKNIAKVLDAVRALPNALNQADDIIKTLIEKGGVETAINLKTGENFTEEDMKQLNTLIQQINSPSPDYEMFAELKRKFFDFEYDKIAEEWVNMHMQDQPESIKNEVKKSMSSYIESQMPQDAIISTITKQANNAAQRRGQDLDYKKAMARIQADKEMFYADFNRHTSATRALYEGMQRLGSDNESIDVTDAGVSDKDGLKMEWEVYNKETGEVDFVNGATIKANPTIYFKNKADANANKPFVPKSTVYVVPTTVDMKKSGKNYNVSTYGNSYESFIDLGGGDKVASTPVGVRVRTPYATAVSNGQLNEGPIISSDNAIGSKFQRSAGNVYSGGGKGRIGAGSSSYDRE
jgi:hypothetical protein